MEQRQDKDQQSLPTSWMPIASGIMSIVAGVMGFITIAFLVTFVTIFGPEIAPDVLHSLGYWQIGIPTAIIGIAAIIMFIVSLVAVIGGVHSLRKKSWKLSLAGAACAVFPVQILGIISIIFVVISKKEFN